MLDRCARCASIIIANMTDPFPTYHQFAALRCGRVLLHRGGEPVLLMRPSSTLPMQLAGAHKHASELSSLNVLVCAVMLSTAAHSIPELHRCGELDRR